MLVPCVYHTRNKVLGLEYLLLYFLKLLCIRILCKVYIYIYIYIYICMYLRTYFLFVFHNILLMFKSLSGTIYSD